MDKLLLFTIAVMVLIPTTGYLVSSIAAQEDGQEKAGSTTIKNTGEDNNTDVKITCTENVEGLVEKCG